MKKLLLFVLCAVFSLQMSFAGSLSETRADYLRTVVKTKLQNSKNPIEDARNLKSFFQQCEKTCDQLTQEASSIILKTFDEDFGLKNTLPTYSLLHVVDWDTIRVKNEKGEERSVRMIGIDAPESSTLRYWYAECYGNEASAHLKELLTWISQVQIEADPTQTTLDKYGRLLGYVTLNGVNINKKMIEDGYAFEYTYNLPYKYRDEFKNAEKEARTQSKWLWANNTCQGTRTEVKPIYVPVPNYWSSNNSYSNYSNSSYDSSSSDWRTYYTWPRGGCYYINSNGNKTYVSHAYCWTSSTESSSNSYSNYSSYEWGHTWHTWPRGWTYYINSHGNKTYKRRR